MEFQGALGLLIPIVALITVFTFVSVAVWAENRRREREAYYKQETLKKVLEHPGEAATQVLDGFRREELRNDLSRRDGMRLGGLITFAVGVGLMIFLFALIPEEPIWLVGLLPLLIGFVLALFSFSVRVERDPAP